MKTKKTHIMQWSLAGIVIFSFMLLLLQSCEESTAFNPELALDNDTIVMPMDSRTTKVRVYSNTKWKAVLEHTETDWLSLTEEHLQEVSLTGNDYIIVNTTTNETGKVRIETIIVSTQNKTHRVTIKQSTS